MMSRTFSRPRRMLSSRSRPLAFHDPCHIVRGRVYKAGSSQLRFDMVTAVWPDSQTDAIARVPESLVIEISGGSAWPIQDYSQETCNMVTE